MTDQIRLTDSIRIPADELQFSAIRAQGAGGQNVNKVASAIHLRFDIRTSSLPDAVKNRLLQSSDQRITADGVLVIKAQNHRTQEKNRAEAIARLRSLVADAAKERRRRIPTRPKKAAVQKRLDEKRKRGELKQLRSRDPE